MKLDGQTIFALSSGAGRAGIAVVRLSGSGVVGALEKLTRKAISPPRQIAARLLHNPADGELIDRGLVVRFEAPHSVTGEDVGECHIHGGHAVVAALVAALTELGLRPAEPGEFTRRAFENGKLDLTEAEGIADLIAAETEIQRRQAVRQMEGSLGRLYETWRARLVRAAALLEVVIDFPDEEVPVNTPDDVIEILETIERDIGQHLLDDHKGERVRDGLRVAVIGAPNVGKSSLVNALARRDAAIVSDVSGTTRDVIEVHLDLAGLPVTVADTAGLRQAGGAVEAEGIRRARKAAAAADIRVFMYDATATDQQIPWGVEPNSGDVSVLNKIDLVREGGGRIRDYIPEPVIPISVKTGAGVRGLLERLTQIATQLVGSGWEGNLTRARHRIALVECQAALHRCLESRPNDIALWAEDVRLGAGALGRITGKIDVESILDAVFSEFCIGK